MVNVQTEHGYFTVDGDVMFLQGTVVPSSTVAFSTIVQRTLDAMRNKALEDRPNRILIQLTTQCRQLASGAWQFAVVYGWPQDTAIRYVPGPMPRRNFSSVVKLFDDEDDNVSDGFNIPDPDSDPEGSLQ